MLRTIAISLILVLSVGVMLPFTNSAHGVRQSVQVGPKRHHRYRSRAWWRRYRARLRQKRLAAELAGVAIPTCKFGCYYHSATSGHDCKCF